MDLTLKPLTPGRWSDLEALFNDRGCSQARGCWCMYYRHSGSSAPLRAGATRAQANRAELKALVESGKPPGLIAYRGKTPVGWVSLGPRDDYAKLRRSPVLKPVDGERVWSILCFVVPQPYRGQGIARALLDGAIAYARRRGVKLLEAYPVDRRGRTNDEFMWFGTKSMFDAAGFVEVARRKPQRPIVRIRPDAGKPRVN
jgi:GNAT superfamily N-acetyltransferase